MENQGNMQSGKKAAVIYFLAAFFIASSNNADAVRFPVYIQKEVWQIAPVL